MPPRSLSRGRARTRTRSPYSDASHRRPGSRSLSRPRRSISPRSPSRTPRRNGRYRSQSRSISRERSASPVRSTKVVVERLSRNIKEEHLREIFGSFGPIRDMDVPINRQFHTNRGTAYILYASEADAEAAIAHMHESQIDGAVISVSIVLPRRKFSPSPPLARRGANIDPRVLANALVDPIETLIPTDQDQSRDHGHQNDIELAHDPFLPDLDLREDMEEEEIVQAEMVAEDGEAQVIVAIVVMMIEVGAEVVDVEAEDVGEDEQCS